MTIYQLFILRLVGIGLLIIFLILGIWKFIEIIIWLIKLLK